MANETNMGEILERLESLEQFRNDICSMFLNVLRREKERKEGRKNPKKTERLDGIENAQNLPF